MDLLEAIVMTKGIDHVHQPPLGQPAVYWSCKHLLLAAAAPTGQGGAGLTGPAAVVHVELVIGVKNKSQEVQKWEPVILNFSANKLYSSFTIFEDALMDIKPPG